MSNEIRLRWREYETKAVPADAPFIQLVETRRAYFAGAMALLDVLLVARERESPRQFVESMDELKRESEDFRAEVEAGRS